MSWMLGSRSSLESAQQLSAAHRREPASSTRCLPQDDSGGCTELGVAAEGSLWGCLGSMQSPE